MEQHLLIQAAFKKPVSRTPVWVMRQAGRYLQEYRNVRKQAGDFLTLCKTPELACQVSLQPFYLIGVDAVILFSDILTPLEGMGMELSFENGPQFNNPIQTALDIEALKIPDPENNTPYVGEILQKIHKELNSQVPVIGFAGAPFTLATYMVEGGSSKCFFKLKKLCFDSPELAHALMKKLTRLTIDYLNYQIQNGAEMVQLFDTWAGELSLDDYHEFVFPYVQEIFSNLDQKNRVPQVYYINGGNHLLEKMASTGANVIGLDWRIDLLEAKQKIGDKVALQGNLDPSILFANKETIRIKTRQILNKFNDHTGHIFNLGHGIHKEVKPDHLKIMVEEVKEFSKNRIAEFAE